jgi:outer membrane receptor for ferrienterochelin and colicins
MRSLCVALLMALTLGASCQSGRVSGRVVSDEGPVAFASVLLKGTQLGTATDAQGRFRLPSVPPGAHVLQVSMVGHSPLDQPFSLKPGEDRALGDLRLTRTATALDEVVVTGTLRPVSRSESPVAIEVVTPALFRKNPSPVLFDAVGMVNGVRPQLNCSVCNTGDIHINGMEGPYTMVLIDGMPIVSALSTVYGLSGIPVSMIERVEVMKGPGSALYGSEAMGGIINVITRDPAFAPKVAVDLMTTSWGELSADVGLRLGRGRVTGLTGVNGFRYATPHDGNGDGFTDVTLQERYSIFQKLGVQRPERRVASMAGRYVEEDRWGGQMQWTPAFAGGDSIYGETIRTRRWEAIGQYQLPLPGTVMLQFSANGHAQRSWYGTTPFNADQHVYFGQLYWGRRLGARHDLLGGVAYRHTRYLDDTPATGRYDAEGRLLGHVPHHRPLPGLFVQDEWSITELHKLLLGYRLDHDRDHGPVHSPRVAYKWAPNPRWAVRANFGTGFRVVNIFTEDHAALTGARTVVIADDLGPERSINGAVNVVRIWSRERRFIGLDGTLFHTHFRDRILPDFDSDPRLIIYAGLDGHAVSRGAALNVETRLGDALRLNAGTTWMEVYTVEEGRRTEVLFAPRWSGTFNASYEVRARLTIDLTGQVYGPMRLPVQPGDPRPDHSPTHALVNLQLKYRPSGRWEVYGGVKNLLNFVPKDPILRPFDPFNKQADDPVSNPHGLTFDPAYIYAPLQGIRGFLGLRWTLT